MSATMFRSAVAFLGIAALVATGAPAFASMLKFKADMSGGGEAPPNNSTGKAGTPGNLASPFKGSTQINEVQKKDLKDGRWYFNVHTPKFPEGEVRGPVVRE
jgi:hypothetical protein